MGVKWKSIKTDERSFEFKVHSTRKNGIKFDRYFRTSYIVKGKRYSVGFGWESQGWTLSACTQKLNYFISNAKKGIKPRNFKEENEITKQEMKEQEITEQENITFGQYFHDRYDGDGENLYQYHIKQVLKDTKLKDIKPLHIERIKKNMIDKGKAPRTVEYCLAIIRQVWNHAKNNDVIEGDSPTKKVKIPKFDNRRVRFLTREEADNLLICIKKRSIITYHISLFALHTGMRLSEIFNLEWSNVDIENGTLTLMDTKSGKNRYVYITDMMENVLKNIEKNTEYVFNTKKGEKIKYLNKSFNRAVNDLGFNDGVTDNRYKVSFHTLRHTFASWHVQNGTDLYMVKDLLGHSTIQLTERYSHLRPDGLKKTVQLFNGTN